MTPTRMTRHADRSPYAARTATIRATNRLADRVADLLARMTTVEKAAQLGSAWVFQLAAGTALTAGAPALMEHGLGQVTRVSGASNVASADAASSGQRDPALPDRGDPARHTNHRSRRGVRRTHGTRRHRVPAADRPRQHVGPVARRTDGDHRAHRDARDRRPPGLVAGARRVPRSAVGPDRRDVRRGPAPRRDDGQRVRARPPGRIARRSGSWPPRSTSSATGPRRAVSTGRRRTSPPASSSRSTSTRSRPPCGPPASDR